MDFTFTVPTDDGVTFTPWTNGWAVGFKVTHPDLPDRYVLLNPCGGTDTRNVHDTDVFVYHATHNLNADDASDLGDPVCYVNIWDKPHSDYPHLPGYLHDCPACEARCHCVPDPGVATCVFDGAHRYGKTA